MSSSNLDSFVAVPIAIELFLELSRRYPRGVSSIIEQVSWDFLDRTVDDFESAPHSSANGIYWGSLFLPEGTEIRTRYFDEYKVAIIQGNEIMWNGKACRSPSRLARIMRGNTQNNAWKVLEVKRPSDAKWVMSDFLRK